MRRRRPGGRVQLWHTGVGRLRLVTVSGWRKPCSGDSVVDELVARLDSLAIECCDRLADFVAMLLVNNFFKIQAHLAFALRAGSVDRSAMQTLCAH